MVIILKYARFDVSLTLENDYSRFNILCKGWVFLRLETFHYNLTIYRRDKKGPKGFFWPCPTEIDEKCSEDVQARSIRFVSGYLVLGE